MSGKHLNDISKVYLDTIANAKKAETSADIKRWEDLGGPTPGNYRADDNSAKLKEGRRLRKSDWREDLREVINTPETEEKAEKKVDEKKVKNKIVINPTFKEAIEEIGGELLEVTEMDDVQKKQDDTQSKQAAHKKQLEAKQKKVAAMKKIVLRKKMQAVATGAGEDITAGYEPEGDMVEAKEPKNCGCGQNPCITYGAENEKKRKNALQIQKIIGEADLSAADRRALPNKDFVFPGKGEGPEGKQRGAYPINDKKHARNALAMAAAHASPEKEAKVKTAVKKKFPDIEVTEDKVLKTIAKELDGASKMHKGQANKIRSHINDMKTGAVDEGVISTLIKPKKKVEKKPEKAMDAGAKAKRMLARKIHAKYVSGSTENVPDDIREEDKAFNYVLAKLKAKHGDGVMTKGDKMPQPSAAQKKKNAEIRAKRAKEDGRDATQKASDGRYSDNSRSD